LLFLVADLVMERRGGAIEPRPPMAQSGLISALFFVGAIAMAGMPPLSGFIGKLLVLDATRYAPDAYTAWAVILIGSFVTIVGLARAGSLIFWKSHDAGNALDGGPSNGTTGTAPEPQPGLAFTAVFSVVAGLILLTLFAGPALEYTNKTAEQLFTPERYISAVLGVEE
ncbi:MAG: proton-conducting transporter membrane subunit, partial [Pseudomonadota bacterium]